MASRSRRSLVSRIVVHVLLLLGSATVLLPLIYMVTTSLKQTGAEFSFPIQWIPNPPTWSNYPEVIRTIPLLMFMKNTLIVVVLSLIGEVITGSLVAFGFARLRFPLKKVLFSVLLATMMLPFFVTMIPQFVIFRTFGWIDTLLPLLVPAFLGGPPLFIFLLRQFYATLPTELDESARMDGAGYLRLWWSILLPLTKPALATVAILSLVLHWNEFERPLIFLNSTRNLTLALGLRYFRDEWVVRYNLLMAYTTMMTIPVMGVFLFFQKYIVKGVSMSGLGGR